MSIPFISNFSQIFNHTETVHIITTLYNKFIYAFLQFCILSATDNKDCCKQVKQPILYHPPKNFAQLYTYTLTLTLTMHSISATANNVHEKSRTENHIRLRIDRICRYGYNSTCC